VVKNNVFENSQNGLLIGFNSNMNVTGNQFNSISQTGLLIVYESASNNLITSNTFSNNGQGVLVDSSTGVVTIQSNTFTNATGISFSSSSNDVVQSNTFNLNSGQTGILYASNVNNTVINLNTFNNGDYGVNGPVGGGSNMLNFTITNNVFTGQGAYGIYLLNVTSSTIANNSIYFSGVNGIEVFGSNNTNISGNIIQNNTNLDVEVTYNSTCTSPSNNTLIQTNNFSSGVFRPSGNNIGVCADCNSSPNTLTTILNNLPNNNSTIVGQENCPVPPSFGLCPYVETLNNGAWSYQGGAILGLVTPYLATWRTEKLYNAGDSNSLSLMVREIPSETGHYNGFKLLVVDHPTGEAFFNQEEDFTPLIVNNPLNVVNCVDSYGRNCLSQVSSNEYSFLQGKPAIQGYTILNQPDSQKNAWFSPINFSNPSQLEDWLQVTLPNGWQNASEIKLLVTGTATGLNSLTEDYWGENNFNHNIVGFIIQNTPLNEIIKKGAYYFSSFKIEAQQKDGSWKTVIGENNCALDDYKTCAISIPTGDVQTGNIRIVEPAFIDAIDSVKVDYTPSFAFVSTLLPSSIDFNNSSFSENTSGFLTSDLIVPQNDFVIVNFTGIPSVKPGFTRSLFLDFNGWYDPSPKDLSLIQKIDTSLKLAGALTQIAFGGSPSIGESVFLKAYPESRVCKIFAKNYCDEK
jgi:parallel beta-helix repeat protein